ncbi:cupredoxin domain-containing protein [Metabacillus arenae]|uniref:Cupredoxin domain-containing protein n=1 Tax=Metabacillus arenae TaxID=2771434 RepID=A0A926NGS1_9BACI|nr:cupredoxin domain-containing protein [Metabacillus arenae]MBD1379733.1 cupredoxin domain-containing protein [Metabacillus arenae]
MKKGFLILLVILILTACRSKEEAQEKTSDVKETGEVQEVTITGYSGDNPEDFKFEPEEVTVSQGDTVKLTLKSNDEIEHGITLYGINQQLKDGETVEFIAEEKGEFAGQCSVFCGPGHGVMNFNLIVK